MFDSFAMMTSLTSLKNNWKRKEKGILVAECDFQPNIGEKQFTIFVCKNQI